MVELMGMLPRSVTHVLLALDGDRRALDRLPVDVVREIVPAPSSAGLLARLRGMRRTIREQNADLVLTYNWGSIEWVLAATFRRLCPVIHHEDGFGPDEVAAQVPRRRRLRRWVLPRANAVVAPSRVLCSIAETTWGIREPKLRYLPNGVDLARFSVPVDRERGVRRDGAVVFVCVGGIRKEKNQALAVAAFARTRCRARARLRIVGDGPERESVAALAQELGVADRVDFTGNVLDTAPQYREAEVFLIPSRTEQMPLSLLEAMASGLAVVGTDVGDVKNMLDEANRRFVVPPGDAAALAAAMDELESDGALRADLGRRNRTRVEQEFDREDCYGRYCELYLTTARAAQR